MDMSLPADIAALGRPRPEPETALAIEGVHKRFEKFTALQQIDLRVQQGEMLCLLGPSGCGKTTLLRIIAGLETQTHGRIVQNGRDISALPPASRDYGIVFQSYALFPNLTVADNVGYGLVNRRLSRSEIRTKVGGLLDLVGLPVEMQGLLDRLHGHGAIRGAVRLLALDLPEQAEDIGFPAAAARRLQAGFQFAPGLLQIAEPGEGGGEVDADVGEFRAAGFAVLLPISQDLARGVADQLKVLALEALPAEMRSKPQILLHPGDQAAIAAELGSLVRRRLGDRQASVPDLVQRADGKPGRAERLLDLLHVMKRHHKIPDRGGASRRGAHDRRAQLNAGEMAEGGPLLSRSFQQFSKFGSILRIFLPLTLTRFNAARGASDGNAAHDADPSGSAKRVAALAMSDSRFADAQGPDLADLSRPIIGPRRSGIGASSPSEGGAISGS